MDLNVAQKEPPQENNVVRVPTDKVAEQKRAVRALKRVLIAKAEVRRLRALTKAKCVGYRR